MFARLPRYCPQKATRHGRIGKESTAMSLCADRGDRTHTLLRELDFESSADHLPERIRVDVCQVCVMVPAIMPRPKESWPIIRPRKNKQGNIMSWMVDCGLMDGRRVRFFYKTKDEAETKAALMRVKRKNEGETSFGMSAHTLQDTKAALALL